MHLDNFVNVFTRENYPAGDDGFSRVPFEDILNELSSKFGKEGFSYKIVHVGTAVNNGKTENCVAVELTVPFNDGFITRPGAAQGTIGISGLICGALNNAVLRHLRMGEELYERNPEQNENSFGGDNIPSNPPTRLQTNGPVKNGQVYGNKNHVNTAPRTYGEWDGKVKVGKGTFAGVAYGDLDLNTLEKWVEGGNPLAVKEMERREKSGLVTKAPF